MRFFSWNYLTFKLQKKYFLFIKRRVLMPPNGDRISGHQKNTPPWRKW